MARNTPIARVTGIATGSGNHAHSIVVELPASVDAATLHNVQITIVGGADGKKRHASALVSIDDLRAALAAAERSIGAQR
jgi:hypothetical protein